MESDKKVLKKTKLNVNSLRNSDQTTMKLFLQPKLILPTPTANLNKSRKRVADEMEVLNDKQECSSSLQEEAKNTQELNLTLNGIENLKIEEIAEIESDNLKMRILMMKLQMNLMLKRGRRKL